MPCLPPVWSIRAVPTAPGGVLIKLAGGDEAVRGVRAVTLDCQVQFLGLGRIGLPLDAQVELLRETKNLAFFQGRVVQEDEIVAGFSGTLRKSSRKA